MRDRPGDSGAKAMPGIVALPLLVAALFTHPAFAETKCTVSDIKVEQFRVVNRLDGGIQSMIGTLLNKCAEDVGAQLRITFLSADGTILRVENPWPARIGNIPAGAKQAFEVMIEPVKGYKTVDVQVQDVFRF